VVIIFIVVVVVTEENAAAAATATATTIEDAVYLIEIEIDQGVDFSSKHSPFFCFGIICI